MSDLSKRSFLVGTGGLIGIGSAAYEFLGESGGGSGRGTEDIGPETSSEITVLRDEGTQMEISIENTGDTILDDTLEVVSSAGIETSRSYQLKPGTTTFISVDLVGWDSYSDIVVRDSHDSVNIDPGQDIEPETNSEITVLSYEGNEMKISIENTGETVVDDTLEVVSGVGFEVSRSYQLKPGKTTFMSLDMTEWVSHPKIVVRDSYDSVNVGSLVTVNLLKEPDQDTARDDWDPTNGNSSEWRVVKYYTKGGQVLKQSTNQSEIQMSLIDVFAVGGGGSGQTENAILGGGGGGGYTKTETGLRGPFDISIGSGGGGNGSDGGSTTVTHVDGEITASGGNGAIRNGSTTESGDGGSGGTGGGGGGYSNESGGNGGSDGSDGGDGATEIYGGAGQGRTTRAFAESGWQLHAGGGGGGCGEFYSIYGDGGAGGGGRGGKKGNEGKPGTHGLGGGGGGGYSVGAKGGDGAVLFRWPVEVEVIEEF